MRRSWAAITVGALVLVGIGITAMIFSFTSEHVSSNKGIVVYALFRDARGLYDKTRVLAAGLDVGQIESRSLDQSANKARVNIRILTDKIKLYENAVVNKKAASLLGEFYLDVDPGTPTRLENGQQVPQKLLKDGDQIIYVGEPTDLGEIINQVGETVPLLRDILRDVHDLTSGQVKDIADNVNDLITRNSATLDQLLRRVDNIAANVEDVTSARADDVKVALRNVRDITEGIKSLVGSSEGEVTSTGQHLRSSIDKLQTSVDSLQTSLKNVEKITGRVAEGEGTMGKLVNDPAIANNVEQITDDASTFVRGIARMQTIVGLRIEYNYLANTFKEYFQVTLAPRPDKFYLIEIVDDPRGFRETSTSIHDSTAGHFSDVVVTTSQKLGFTFQLGKCWYWFCGRFGIKESTGGAGFDLHFLNDRLMLTADIFDAEANTYPRLTGRAIYSFYKQYLSLIVGVDDVLNYTPTRGGAGGFFDWFFGAQLQFNDEDLKSLLLFGGSALGSAASK